MKTTTKELIRRTLRTFAQTALGYISVNLAYIISGAGEDFDALKTGLLGLLISATAAGLAAIMNLPVFQKPGNNEQNGEEESENIYENEEEQK